MKTWTLPALQDWWVIVKGPIEEANKALGDAGIQRPFRHTSWNNYGSLHATVTAEEDQMRDWFRRSHERAPDGAMRPGSLCWYSEETVSVS